MAKVTMLDAAGFKSQVEQSGELTLVDFYADWCGPCKMIGPILEELVDEYEGKLNIVKLNADEHPEVLQKYGVRGLPTLMMFDGGAPVGTAVGAQPRTAIQNFIGQHL